MINTYRFPTTDGLLRLWQHEASLKQAEPGSPLLTLAWNQGDDQKAIVDEVSLPFPSQSILPLMTGQTFRFAQPTRVVAWQFNRDFYCIMDHDQEVSCVGFLFYGSADTLLVRLDTCEQQKFGALLEVFVEEFETADTIQGEMLRMLLKRLIIKTTRLGKQQHVRPELTEDRLDIVRQFNVLVEQHYQQEHQVQFYADQLSKSPKTLSNLFRLYHHQSPSQVIQQRVVREAKRLFHYTELSAKEVAYQLGFHDAAHFSRFFKRTVGVSPTAFKQSVS